MAYGVLGLRPWEFYQMTAREFSRAVEGFHWLQEKGTKQTAWAVSNVANTCGHLKKGQRIRVDQLAPNQNISPNNPFYKALLGRR